METLLPVVVVHDIEPVSMRLQRYKNKNSIKREKQGLIPLFFYFWVYLVLFANFQILNVNIFIIRCFLEVIMVVLMTKPGTSDFVWNGIPLSMELNLWNIKEYSGSVAMKFDGEKITFDADIQNLSPKEPERYVLGYPEFYYGYKPWENHTAEGSKLPVPVSSMKSFSVEVSFDIHHEPSLPLNFAMETWLTREKYQTEASIGDVEIMVWFYFNNLTPGGEKIEEFTIPFVLNGESVEGTWELWLAEWGWDYLAFRLKDPVKKGRVKFDVRHFLDAAGKALSSSARVKDFEDLYFTVWEIGTEFGSPETKSAQFGWKFENFSIDLEVRE
ncbi:Endo-1,4-beta-glucanase precursor [Thermotoga maritima MSB8]|nr:Endo-1,4-beta-glucanase precursor [Thermotoga maritima MSB8]